MKSTSGQCNSFWRWGISSVVVLFLIAGNVSGVLAQAVPGGTLDPKTIPKYVQPLVIPPVMKNDGTGDHNYDIAVRQFKQQILPGAHWNAVSQECQNNPGLCNFPATTVWSYGPAADVLPDSSGLPGGAVGLAPALNSQFNYPAFTVENIKDATTSVDWINDLKENFGAGPRYLKHLLPIDQTLHWANPAADCIQGPDRTDCRGKSQVPYQGPVPIVTHVHGAHSTPQDDGYPEAWYLPDPTGSNFKCVTDPRKANPRRGKYVCMGTFANAYGETNTQPGVASFSYANDQPTATYWYHDHSLGMTRNNVYAGPAGFWLLRNPAAIGGEDGLVSGTLPGPAPQAGDDPNFDADRRAAIREIPIVIQDRSFNRDGSLFYPANRAFFEGLGDGQTPSTIGNLKAGLLINFAGGPIRKPSDIAPIWNPEAFFNTMVVNGTTWPVLKVAQAKYRLRLLDGCNSRFLNLAMFVVDGPGADGVFNTGDDELGKEIPFYQIGAEQSLLPAVVKVETGEKNGMPAAHPDEALLMGPAERADTIVDFANLPNGTRIRMINTAPDAPFGGFPDTPADPDTSGQVMEFVVDISLNGKSPTDPGQDTPATDPTLLSLTLPDPDQDALPSTMTRDLALLEEESAFICVNMRPNGRIVQDIFGVPNPDVPETCIGRWTGRPRSSVPFAPKAAVLGINGSGGPLGEPGGATVTLWSDPVATRTRLGDTETWELWNWSADAHPIHLHLVKYKVVDRQVINPDGTLGFKRDPELTEAGWKDTLIAYPGEVTRVKSTFDIAGLYVWHCHIVEHEDNEMMVPYCVDYPNGDPGPGCENL